MRVFGAFVESKKWLLVWAIGAMSTIAGFATMLLKKKYGTNAHPESVEQALDLMAGVSLFFFATLLPVAKYFLILCERDWGSLVPPRLRVGGDDEEAPTRQRGPKKQIFVHSHPDTYSKIYLEEGDLYNPE